MSHPLTLLCEHAETDANGQDEWCPFCRAEPLSHEEFALAQKALFSIAMAAHRIDTVRFLASVNSMVAAHPERAPSLWRIATAVHEIKNALQEFNHAQTPG